MYNASSKIGLVIKNDLVSILGLNAFFAKFRLLSSIPDTMHLVILVKLDFDSVKSSTTSSYWMKTNLKYYLNQNPKMTFTNCLTLKMKLRNCLLTTLPAAQEIEVIDKCLK